MVYKSVHADYPIEFFSTMQPQRGLRRYIRELLTFKEHIVEKNSKPQSGHLI